MGGRRAGLVVGLGFAAIACGLRTEPVVLFDTEGETASEAETGDLPPSSSCAEPIELPLFDTTITGLLRGSGRQAGWCGVDAGAEDIYRLRPAEPTDVTLEVRTVETAGPQALTVRVYDGDCGQEARVCGDVFAPGALSFFAEPGRDTFVVVDAPSGAELAYGLSVRYGNRQTCSIHPQVITQEAGTTFRWFNDLPAGQGELDGPCGGSGRENAFELLVFVPGTVDITAIGSMGLDPVLSLRTGCGGSTELACSPAGGSRSASLGDLPLDPGSYLVVVDSAGLDGGSYELAVSFR